MNDPQIHTIFTGKVDHAKVRQDKYAPERISAASGQPVRAATPAPMPKHHGSNTRLTVEVAGYVKPSIRAELERIAKQQKLSLSKVVASLLEKGIQGEIDMQYGALLEPVIRDQIHRDMQAFSNRVAHLAVKTQNSAEESRLLLIKILSLLLDTDRDVLNHLIAEAEKEARTNVIRTMEELGFI